MKKLTPKRAFEMIFISFFLITMIAYVAVAATPTMEEQLISQRTIALDAQTDLHNKANAIRTELDALLPRVEQLQASLEVVKKEWDVQQGRIYTINDTLEVFTQEQQSL